MVWNGCFLEHYKNTANIGGYFSYIEQDISKCIFFSKIDKPRVIGTVFFDSTYNSKNAKIDLKERDFTDLENDLYTMRVITLAEINSDTSLFKKYESTNLNLIPLIHNAERKVYVLTGPQQNGVVIFGNDYLLTFDDNNNLTSKKQLHRNIISIHDNVGNGEKAVATIHSHLPETGDFITATDICTLMLYEKFTTWKQHNVVSKNYLNIWNCLTDTLIVISMDAFNKINKDQEKRNKKKKRNK